MACVETNGKSRVTGIIGTGSMGGMLVRKFLESGAIKAPGDIIASNRSPQKLHALSMQTGIREAADNREVARTSDIIFLCVKPLEVHRVLEEISGHVRPGSVVVSIAGDVRFEDFHAWSRLRVVRAIPSITSECLMGVTLLAFDREITLEERDFISALFGSISTPVVVREEDFELLADLTSCAPAFIAALMGEFAAAACRRAGVPDSLAATLVKKTLQGTTGLLLQENTPFEEVVHRVATRGGITEEGVKVIRKAMPGVYDELFEVTLAKHTMVRELIREEAGKNQHLKL
jgi:competence protein ComER